MPRVLLLEAANWPMAANLPRALRAAGFEVGVLASAESVIYQTAFADARFHYPRHSLCPWKIIRTLDRWAPDLVVPCDDNALRYLVEGPGEKILLDAAESSYASLCAQALGDLGAAAESAVPALEEAISDEHGDVCVAASAALSRIRAASH